MECGNACDIGKIRIVRIRQAFERAAVGDIESEVRKEYSALGIGGALSGKRVGITAGSRGIGSIVPVLRALVAEVRKSGGEPVLLAAMGSHGGGAATGQKDVLDSLCITEEAVGAPIVTCGECAEIGETSGGLKAYMLESAFSVDAIIPVNRIKVHTAFHGEVESGLYKMLVVGLGGPKGAAQFHSKGSCELPSLLLSVGGLILEKMPVAAGFAIVENGYEETALIKGIASSDFRLQEPKLLDYARSLMPSLPSAVLDALIIEEMGKNYSGTGVDTNIIGRLRIQGVPEPDSPAIGRIGVLDLSAESHGNANGVGLADAVTDKLVGKIDLHATYLNCTTTGFLMRGATPVHLPTEREMTELMLRSLGGKRPEEIRLVQIPNTLHLTECFVSEALLPEVAKNSKIQVISDPMAMEFDQNGDLVHRIGRAEGGA